MSRESKIGALVACKKSGEFYIQLQNEHWSPWVYKVSSQQVVPKRSKETKIIEDRATVIINEHLISIEKAIENTLGSRAAKSFLKKYNEVKLKEWLD